MNEGLSTMEQDAEHLELLARLQRRQLTVTNVKDALQQTLEVRYGRVLIANEKNTLQDGAFELAAPENAELEHQDNGVLRQILKMMPNK